MSTVREFTPLKIRKRLLGAGAASKYRIYRTKADFITLEARTATEACKVSGIKRPYKIVRISPNSMKMLDSSVFEGAQEDTVETPRLEMEGDMDPIIIPAPMAKGAKIIDDYDWEGAGGFTQVPLTSMGKRNAEDAAALKKVVEEIAAESQQQPTVEKPVIITPDMITIDVTPGTNEPIYKLAEQPETSAASQTVAAASSHASQPSEAATVMKETPPVAPPSPPLAPAKDMGDYTLVGTAPGEATVTAQEKEDYTREEMLLKQMMEQRVENPPQIEKPEAMRKVIEIDIPAVSSPSPAPSPAKAVADSDAGSVELTQEEIARLLGEK